MSEAERQAEVHRWLRYAHEDLAAAEAMLGRPEMMPLYFAGGAISPSLQQEDKP
jgi:predicted NAD/FAD-dependent oxidoreductase